MMYAIELIQPCPRSAKLFVMNSDFKGWLELTTKESRCMQIPNRDYAMGLSARLVHEYRMNFIPVMIEANNGES